MDKRTITAFIMIFLVAFSYPYIMQKLFPHLSPPPPEEEVITDEENEKLSKEEAVQSPAQEHEKDLPQEKEEFSLETFEEKKIPLAIGDVSFTFSNRGGSISSVEFLKYQTSFDYSSSEEYVLAISSIGRFSGLENMQFTIEEQTDTRIVWQSILKEENLKIEKIFETTDKDYLYTVRLKLTNLGPEKFYMERGPVIVSGSIITQEKKRRYAVEEATALRVDDEIQRIPKKKIEGALWMDSKYRWVGLQEPTVCFILMNRDKAIDGWGVSKKIELIKGNGKEEKGASETEIITTMAKLEVADIPPGDSVTYNMTFYAGPKLYYHLASIGNDFKRILDFGKMLAPISRGIIWGLNKLFHVFHNYGICIIIITIIVKIILYPLTHSSMKSMKRMKDLQPHMEAIREQYKDDPQRMNREVLALYKKHKVNPVGGCFPIFLQLPIFIALFKTLNNAVELKGASFLWIKDLSAPDTIFMIGSFPVNVLPLIMGLTQFISQKQTVTDQKQAQMMYFMTVFFMFIFYNMPSGLVLYWLISNVLSIIQQGMINKKT
ncbi:MAG: membrane protein insertase YidC [Candidatus Aureabacteria bacterium]|nr:membrane protein insertase YidC [Candidatus Auribacterota bacterium]